MDTSDEFNQEIINKILPSLIQKIGLSLGVPVIDIFSALGGADLKYKNYFSNPI